jgi:hypothetical protein
MIYATPSVRRRRVAGGDMDARWRHEAVAAPLRGVCCLASNGAATVWLLCGAGTALWVNSGSLSGRDSVRAQEREDGDDAAVVGRRVAQVELEEDLADVRSTVRGLRKRRSPTLTLTRLVTFLPGART